MKNLVDVEDREHQLLADERQQMPTKERREREAARAADAHMVTALTTGHHQGPDGPVLISRRQAQEH